MTSHIALFKSKVMDTMSVLQLMTESEQEMSLLLLRSLPMWLDHQLHGGSLIDTSLEEYMDSLASKIDTVYDPEESGKGNNSSGGMIPTVEGLDTCRDKDSLEISNADKLIDKIKAASGSLIESLPVTLHEPALQPDIVMGEIVESEADTSTVTHGSIIIPNTCKSATGISPTKDFGRPHRRAISKSEIACGTKKQVKPAQAKKVKIDIGGQIIEFSPDKFGRLTSKNVITSQIKAISTSRPSISPLKFKKRSNIPDGQVIKQEKIDEDLEYMENMQLEKFLSDDELDIELKKSPKKMNNGAIVRKKKGVPLTIDQISARTTCAVCQRKFSSRSNLKTHMLVHKQKRPYPCDTCEKSFTSKHNLERHLRSHKGIKPIECPLCQRRFSENKNLKSHMLIHKGEKPMRCTICEKRFRQSSSLKLHMLTHIEAKDHLCDLCGKRFRYKNQLIVHKTRHKGTTDFHCDVCDKSYKTAMDLSRHKKTHEPEFSCDVCGKKFALRTALQNHVNTHTGARPYGCPLCDMSFMSQSAVSRHRKYHHNTKGDITVVTLDNRNDADGGSAGDIVSISPLKSLIKRELLRTDNTTNGTDGMGDIISVQPLRTIIKPEPIPPHEAHVQVHPVQTTGDTEQATDSPDTVNDMNSVENTVSGLEVVAMPTDDTSNMEAGLVATSNLANVEDTTDISNPNKVDMPMLLSVMQDIHQQEEGTAVFPAGHQVVFLGSGDDGSLLHLLPDIEGKEGIAMPTMQYVLLTQDGESSSASVTAELTDYTLQ